MEMKDPDMRAFTSISPTEHADKLKKPIQGANDPRVPLESLQMVEKFKQPKESKVFGTSKQTMRSFQKEEEYSNTAGINDDVL